MHKFPFDIVGFDLDGTLLNTAGDLGVALNHALYLAGRPQVAPQDIHRLVGGGTRMMLSRALDQSGGPVDEATMNHLTDALVSHYEANIATHTQLYPGGAAMLAALAQRGVKLAIVTNKLERLAVKLFAELGLTDHFYTIIGGDTLGPGRAKPKPDLLHLMVERSGLPSPRAAYVGDTTFDTYAAQAAAIPCVAVSFGFRDRPAQDLGADAVIDHFGELVGALEKL